jgi:hypothetical protein
MDHATYKSLQKKYYRQSILAGAHRSSKKVGIGQLPKGRGAGVSPAAIRVLVPLVGARDVRLRAVGPVDGPHVLHHAGEVASGAAEGQAPARHVRVFDAQAAQHSQHRLLEIQTE